ncbi:hypothetical protein [Rickettsia australis]|uniref:hypothetical protein n=1 Tax=Rickettsia australis TaxID=787 RepID=UPI0038B6A58D
MAYSNKADYQSAKKYYLAALEYLPKDQQTIFEQYKVYLKLNEIDNAKHSRNYLTSKDLKHLLKISQDLPTVSTKGLASINKMAILHASIL